MIFDEFDSIYTSDGIKQKILHSVMEQRGKKRRTGMTAALTLCVTCLLVVLFQPWRLMEASSAPAPAPTLVIYSYATLDINSSMEWRLNEQQQVVRVTVYNKDVDNIPTELQLEGVQLDTALRMLLNNEQFSVYMKTGFLGVSVYSENSNVFLGLEQQINQQLEEVVPQNQSRCPHLDDDTHQEAQQYHISAGKYCVIGEILRHNPAKSVEEPQELDIKELYSVLEHYDPLTVPEGCHRRQIRKGHHHGG